MGRRPALRGARVGVALVDQRLAGRFRVRRRSRRCSGLFAAWGDGQQQPDRRGPHQAGAEHVQQHDGPGQPGEVLHEPDDALAQLDQQQQRGRAGDPQRRAERAQPEPHRQGQPDEPEDGVGVQLGDRLRVEARAGGLGVAGVRPAAGDDGAEHEHGGGHGGDQDPGGADRGRRGPARRDVTGALPEHVRQGDQQHRGEEVRHHRPRVERHPHGDAAEDALPGDAGHHRHGGLQQPGHAVTLPPRGEQRDDGDDAEHERQGPVAELDDAVVAHRPGRHVGLVGAARPRRAAQPRPGQPDEAAGADDPDVGDQRRERRPAQHHRPVEQR